ncbi:hypothetical protein DH2020_025274 [Rehmannia glutinosa]|uniref:TFIIS central domain-containing protein n=1 Tax=Rehmannia glutinosa TaxID=99300 RepID=A0ABR0W067_REHGL
MVSRMFMFKSYQGNKDNSHQAHNLISQRTYPGGLDMEHGSLPLNLPVSEMHMKMVGQVSSNPESHHFYVSAEERGRIEPISSNTGFNTSMIPYNRLLEPISSNRVGHNESSGGSMGSNPVWMPDQLGCENGSLMNNMAEEKTPFPVKRKAEVGSLTNSSISQQSLLPNKRPAHMGADVNSVGFLPPSAPQRKTTPAQSKLGSPGLPAQHSVNKKMVRNDSISGKSGLQRGQSAKRQTAQIESASKKQDNVSNTEKNQTETSVTHQPKGSQASETNSTMSGHVPVFGSEEVFPSKESAALSKTNEGQFFLLNYDLMKAVGMVDKLSRGLSMVQFCLMRMFHLAIVSLPKMIFCREMGFLGHLSLMYRWGGKEAQNAEDTKFVKEEAQGHKEVVVLTPENLAFKIEAELFKLFGDVNKKYREKGRSLLFNLKDRNNPDLRERVMSGEISPERLCSMSAEELASRSYQSGKTHKGEYQVEVEHDDVIVAEISSGTSTTMLTQRQPKKETVPHSPSKASLKDKEKVAGMIVDELKDAEFLPPIVSLDEFMESLNNEPPFENLSVDAGQKIPLSHGESPKLARNSRASNRASNSPKDASSNKAGVFRKHDVTTKSSQSPAKQNVLPSIIPKIEYIWDGTLQLNISSSVAVGGLFQSGEKTSMKEWPSSLEIKGRVRLDAFEKFLQELHMSRTRAVMVLQFVLKDKSSENQRANLSEAIDSYVTDERLGYAEPAPGVELYLCPPTPRITDTLNKLITPKENPETNNPIENRLIGVVVWRRAHISNTISPNSSSHHKHSLKKQAFPPPKRVRDSSNVNPNTPTRTSSPVFNKQAEPQKEDDDDDDIPPGFGPAAVARGAGPKDDDDLPEFNFSPSVPRISPQNLHHGVKMSQQRPVEEVRELIKKYGQSGNSLTNRVDNRGSIGIEPWNDDAMMIFQSGGLKRRHHNCHPIR